MRARTCAWWALVVAAAAGARELDPATCAPRFDVQRDKIIRTEESRAMGARYLSELDVGTRHECLHLCCETDACDVFVYEEKGLGSCYLFKCGPPEDFRCKFTGHGNFSSGVMAVSRRLAELQDQEQLTHHEQELASLRSGTSSTPRSTTSATAAPPPPSPHPIDAIPPRRCSRYQFECRRGGECIAVYNACDGVPQCADGSDEAPELGCPSASPAPPPAAQRPATPAVPTAAPPSPPPQPRYKPHQQESSEGAEGLAVESERWPHRLAQAQAQPSHHYNDGGTSSHIFSHKGGLLQEVDPAQYPLFEAPWPRTPWLHQNAGNGMEGMSGERGWIVGPGAAMGPVAAPGSGGYGRAEWPEPEPEPEGGPRRSWPVPQPRPDPPELPVYIPPKTMPEVPMAYSSRQQTLRDSPKKGFELSKPEPTEAPRIVPPPSLREPRPGVDRTEPDGNAAVLKADTKKLQSPAPAPGYPRGGVEEGEKKASAEAHQHYPAADEHDGLSEHPPAAVLLLVIGVLMTVAMGAMLGCRARAARRRLRRGKAPFAHDADYLVNGMYL